MHSEHPPLSPAWIEVFHMRYERLAREEAASNDFSDRSVGRQTVVPDGWLV